MADTKTSPYRQRVVADNVVPVHEAHGIEAQTCNVGVPRPLPCIVILVHGVNDEGEAYPNQETGIIDGLHKRLDRTDLYPHEWKGTLTKQGEAGQQKIKVPGRSPVIPFYWGYKPVTHDDWKADQKKYRDEVSKLSDGAHLPYDTYQENDPEKMAAMGNDGSNTVKFQNDSFKNTLDVNFAQNGGTFANATTNIPDMLGPGSNGLVVAAAGFGTLYMNGGNFTHPIFHNPHRIYQFFAAQRLADLILQIRNNQETRQDVINIVAHSQGTIITMLANMLVKQQGEQPANCVILNHSPYSLESRFSENLQEGHHQTDTARQKTFKNFCHLMATQYKGGQHTEEEISMLEKLCALQKHDKNKWRSDPRYSRNNHGKVYNYFCPVDGTVSLQNVQGIGWRGVPKDIAAGIPNLYQRVFYQYGEVGKAPDGQPFTLPAAKKGDFKTTPVMNARYDFHDVIVNGEELPETFTFTLMGEGNQPDNDPATCDTPYSGHVDPASPDQSVSYSAKAGTLSRTKTATYALNNDEYRWPPGHVLSKDERAIESTYRGKTVVKGIVTGTRDFKQLELTWLKSRDELEKEWKQLDPVGYSQHSSIVMSQLTPSHAMAFDLAVGQCKSFDYKWGEFWMDLLHRADWRDPQNKFYPAKNYYLKGLLDEADTKKYMNKPNGILPSGEFGVVNIYYNSTTVRPAQYPETHNVETTNLQWGMPKPLNDNQLK